LYLYALASMDTLEQDKDYDGWKESHSKFTKRLGEQGFNEREIYELAIRDYDTVARDFGKAFEANVKKAALDLKKREENRGSHTVLRAGKRMYPRAKSKNKKEPGWVAKIGGFFRRNK
jgi:hypothetical protein